MKFVEITGKKFRLGSRFARLFAFFIDGTLLASILAVLFFFLETMSFPFQIGLLSALLWILGPKTKLPRSVLVVAQVLLVFLFGPLGNNHSDTLALSGIALWAVGMSLMDGFKNGQGLGKKLLSLQVLRLKDGDTTQRLKAWASVSSQLRS
ncbi:hypothetical protein F4X10_02575, partial [Candidatus Poribacteria bacterium]|nr:hypothetical protein [Candidatus Poribacteria bacterium]